MSRFYERAPSEIPEPENSDAKEVFAFFGLCCYWAQILEQGTVNLGVGLRARNATRLDDKDFNSLFEKLGRKTLGQLIKDVRRYVKISSEFENRLWDTVQTRNYLVHRYFATHDLNFLSNIGRHKMIDELRDMTSRFQTVDRELEDATHALWHELGLTAEMFQGELEEMRRQARVQDQNWS